MLRPPPLFRYLCVGLGLTACNAKLYVPGTPIDSVLSSAQVTVTFPASRANAPIPASWFLQITGTCSETGKPVSLRADGVVLGVLDLSAPLVCKPDGTFSVTADLSATPVGRFEVHATQLDSLGVVSAPARIFVSKPKSACDTLANRRQGYAAGFAGGLGTAAAPYLICTANQLNDIRNLPDARYRLLSDIDFLSPDSNGDGIGDGTDTDYRAGNGWAPISGFSGTLDGDGFRINGLRILSNSPNTGFFDTGSGIVSHLFLSAVDVTSTNTNTGALAGNGYFALLDVHGDGTVSGADSTGGLIGSGQGPILSSEFNGTVRASDYPSGGIAGRALGTISECRFTGLIEGTSIIGGIVGTGAGSPGPYIYNSFVDATIRGEREVGGVGGSYVFIRNSYSKGRIEATFGGNLYFGGLAGYSSQVMSSFSTMDLAAPASGGVAYLCGDSCTPGSTNNHYSNAAQCSSNSACVIEGTGHSPLWFEQPSNAPQSSWDWMDTTSDGNNNVWSTNANGTPLLWWMDPANRSNWTAPFPGQGSLADPYRVSTVAQLQAIQGNTRWMEAAFEVENAIDLSNAALIPVGNLSAFLGSWTGNSHLISNLTVTGIMGPTGFFAETQMAAIQDFAALNFTVSGTDYAGGIIGRSSFDSLSNLTATNVTMTGTSAIGGLIGTMEYSTLTRGSASGTVTGTDNLGGLFGYSTNASASILAADVDVTGRDRLGGIAGGYYHGNNRPLVDFYSRGDVSGRSILGGAFGEIWYGNTERGYALGNVTGTGGDIGGMIGNATFSGSTFRRTFCAGNVTGNSGTNNVGVFVGSVALSGNQSANYFTSSSALTNNGGGGTNTSMTAGSSTTAGFQSGAVAPETFWNFSTIWLNNSATNGYPSLR